LSSRAREQSECDIQKVPREQRDGSQQQAGGFCCEMHTSKQRETAKQNSRHTGRS